MLARRWHQGVYRRIAAGCVTLVVIIFTVEAGLFALVTQRWGRGSSSTDRIIRLGISRAIAIDLVRDLHATPGLNIGDWLERPSNARGRVFVILKDGREFGPVPPTITELVLRDLRTLRDDDPMPDPWKRSHYSASLLKSEGQLLGVLGTLPMSTWERFGPLFGGVGIALLGFGAVAISLMVAHPIRARLNNLAEAAYRLKAGHSEARAAEEGTDEVADVARAFNEMADELVRRTSALEASDRLRRQLLADVSHELMTPLTAVLGNLETLTMEEITIDPARQRKRLAIASREAQRLKRVIGDLLDIARLEDGGFRLSFEEIQIAEIFDDIVDRHELECRRRGIQVTSSVRVGATVRGDRFRIEQALDNLLTNALRHTPDGGKIQLRAQAQEDIVVMTVSDSGAGIPEQHLPYVFDRFYKVSACHGIASPGCGLGLAIVKAIAERHGGGVRVSSQADAGTTVSMEIPRGHSAAA